MILNQRGKPLYVAPAVRQALGYTPEQFLQFTELAFIVAKQRDEFRQMLAGLDAANDSPAPFQTLMRHQSGAWHLLQGEARRVAVSPEHWVAVINARNLTRQWEMDLELQRANRLESLGVLVGSISHDFNNLLAVILAQAALAGRQTPTGAPASRHIEQVVLAADKAASLVEQLLIYSQRQESRPTIIQLNQLLEDNLTLLKSILPKTIELVIAPQADLPPIEGHPAQAQQIIMNLIINAADAYEGRGGKVVASTAVTRIEQAQAANLSGLLLRGDYATLTVQDWGKGMDDAALSRIFDPFFTTKVTGRGLGLAALKSIIRAYNGDIRVVSQPGEGTTFTILLPASSKAEPPATSPTTPQAQAGSVLVIEDETAVRRTFCEVLQTNGLYALSAADGLAGLALLQERRAEIDLVLLDLTMPGLSGAETLRQIRAAYPNLPVIVLSGYAPKDSAIDWSALGDVAYLRKPVSIDLLLTEVYAALSNRCGQSAQA
jgi:signal transduction histidine kinase/CheY-like chemotaxis protein